MLLTPADRDDTYNQAEDIIAEAVARTLLTLSGGGSGVNAGYGNRASGSSLPGYGTTAGVNEDGEVYTQHVGLWDVDLWDDAGSLWG